MTYQDILDKLGYSGHEMELAKIVGSPTKMGNMVISRA